MQSNNPPRASFEKVVTSENQSVFWKHAIRKAFRTSYHYHPECELIHIRQGYGRRWVGRSITHFGPGDLVFIAPNVPHIWQVAPDCPQAETFYIQFLPDFAGPGLFILPEMKPVRDMIASARGGVTFSKPVCKEVALRLEQIKELNSTECLLSLLDILYRLSMDQGRLPLGIAMGRTGMNQRQEERIEKVFEYINKHLNEPISQAEIAQRVHLSPAAFSRLFKSTTGKCFMGVVNELRISQACRLLDETNRTISEIAFECGYETLSHFNSKFRKTMDMTPSEYRRNLEGVRGQP
ncbi:MAG: AraC family transcriptional regulator [Kiritimatiellales bacterium]|nr:AraC family transcriptional regulator [Kiritimatiellales bacterium]